MEFNVILVRSLSQ